MHFALNDEQAMIAQSAARVLMDNFGRDAIKRFVANPKLEDGWRRLFGETGLIGLCASPDVGGLGLGCVAALAVAVNVGALAVPFPLMEGMAAAAALSALPDVAGAVIEGQGVVAIADAGISVAEHGERIVLDAALGPVNWATQADGLIIDGIDRDGAHSLYFVDMTSVGVTRTPRTGIDLTTPLADVLLAGVPAVGLGVAPPGWREQRVVLAAAELEGAAQACLKLALDHMKSRRQFGQEIGKFQALKHIAANDALHVESMSVANGYAAWAIDARAPDMAEAVAIAKSYASDVARVVAQDSIQCHGGIGFTWDYGLHFYLRRILRLAATLGTAHDHREQLFDLVAADQLADGV